jgi:molecular chaperone DnaJ
MEKRCYYEILGVSRQSGDQDIKSAFRKLAKQWHPDANPGDATCERRFIEINEAYEALKDPQKRAAYDRFGHAAFEGGLGGARAGANGFGADFSSSMSDIFDDLFGEFMGGARQTRGRRGRERGGDLRYNMEITLSDAYHGKRAEVRVPSSVTCEACTGSGSAGGVRPISCNTCGGIGRVRASQGFFTIERTCPSCQGAGEVVENPCDQCNGSGRQTRERALAVESPPGVEDGTRIRLAGEGEAGLRGGPAGDLYIFLSLEPHEFFQRDGADLFCRVPIQMTTAALGGQIEVPTIAGGRVSVRVPEGTEADHQFRIHGKGMPVLRSKSTGDLYVQVEVETPKNLTRKQKELLREFEKASTQKTSPEASGFLSRVKAFWERVGDSH